MNRTNQTLSHHNSRPNQEWVAALRGTLGAEAQQNALEDLAKYQQVVAFNHLTRCTTQSETLSILNREEIGTLAEDHTYTFIEKLVQDDFALLEKYSGTGRFTAWTAKVLTNAMTSEMRRVAWRRQVPMSESVSENYADVPRRQPEQVAIQNSITATIQNGLEALPERYQIVLTRCLINGESSKSVAEDLETTVNAVNVLAYRAKQKLRKYLISQGMDETAAYHFA